MNKYVASALLFLQLLMPTTLVAQNEKDYSGTYLCISDTAGGIRFDDVSKKWVSAKFTSGDRYILTTTSSGLVKDEVFQQPTMTYHVTWEPHGANYDAFMKGCWTQADQLKKINPYMSFGGNGSITCNLAGGELKINLQKLRYLQSYTFGFVDGIDDGGNTPLVEIGNCTKIN